MITPRPSRRATAPEGRSGAVHPSRLAAASASSDKRRNRLRGDDRKLTLRVLHHNDRADPERSRGSATWSADALKIEIRRQQDDIANGHAAWPRQHEHYHVCHFARLQETSLFPG